MISFNSVPGNFAASATFWEQYGVRAGVGGSVIQHRLALLGQALAAKSPTVNVPRLISSEAEAITLYGRGSMLHLMYRKAVAQNPYGQIYAVPLADGTTAASGSILVSAAITAGGTYALFIGGQKVSVAVPAGTAAAAATLIAAAINAALDLPVTATVSAATVTLVPKWKGVTGNDIRIQLDLDAGDATAEPVGGALTITQMSGGATNPDPTAALAALGGTWFTAIANPYQDATAITAIESAALVRGDPGVKMPLVAVFGYTGTKANFQTAVAARNSPYASWVPVEDSPNLPLEVAATAAALFCARQSIQPGTPMRGRQLVGIRAGQAAAWTAADNNNTVLFGGSTTKSNADGTVQMVDFTTTYKTNASGAVDELYRFVNWIGNWQYKLYSLDLMSNSEPFIDALVVDDKAITEVSYAVNPKTIKVYAIDLVRNLWAPMALTKDVDAVVAGIVAEIDKTNAGRINIQIPDVFAAGLRIIAGKVQWSFTAPAVAA